MMRQFKKAPGHLIRRAHQISSAIFQAQFSELDLTPLQCAAVAALGEAGAMDATRLAAVIAIDAATLGPVIERLERKGLLVRGPRPGDKRIKEISLTPAGTGLLDAIATNLSLAQEKLLGSFTQDERRTFVRLLGKLIEVHTQE